jgi:hypothetical protein
VELLESDVSGSGDAVGWVAEVGAGEVGPKSTEALVLGVVAVVVVAGAVAVKLSELGKV